MTMLRAAVYAALALWPSPALADLIEPGLWRIISRVEIGGAPTAPQASTKCVTPEQSKDLAKTFAPAPTMINSECGALEQSLEGNRLRWKLLCVGQLDMELTGDYTFIDPQHYSATVWTRSAMAGRLMNETRTTLYAERIQDCPLR
jgi:hypothetical protein